MPTFVGRKIRMTSGLKEKNGRTHTKHRTAPSGNTTLVYKYGTNEHTSFSLLRVRFLCHVAFHGWLTSKPRPTTVRPSARYAFAIRHTPYAIPCNPGCPLPLCGVITVRECIKFCKTLSSFLRPSTNILSSCCSMRTVEHFTVFVHLMNLSCARVLHNTRFLPKLYENLSQQLSSAQSWVQLIAPPPWRPLNLMVTI